MGRHANPDIRRAFSEFQDTDTPSKCNKVRCLHCGFVRAKNTTRQIEHLQDCQPYLASPDAQAHLAAQQSGDGTPREAMPPPSSNGQNILSGQHPNPNLHVQRRGPNSKRPRDQGQPIAPYHGPNVAPSLTAHLLAVCRAQFTRATQQPFLTHAGCGSLAAGALSQWLVQDAHYARGYIRFVGQLLAKIRLPHTPNSQFHPMYRTMDLLISALNNMRREMQFFEITATKYGLSLGPDPATPITRSLLDLFANASSSSASLLEGMVVLWGTEHCYRSAWQFASSFSASLTTPSGEAHIVALHQALIPNWTSPAFSKFVDATRSLVDELANTTTARDGKEEMVRCEEIFGQICWLEERFWPDVDGMGEEDEGARLDPASLASQGAAVGGLEPTYTNTINAGMNGSIGNGASGSMNNALNNSLNSGMNGSMNNGMTNNVSNGMSGGMTNNMTNGMNGPRLNGGDGTPVSDGRHSFAGLPNGIDVDQNTKLSLS